MPKTFYTDRDIEDLASRGVISLVIDDDIVLTDLARDKAMRLGIELMREHDQPPAAPERPYITELTSPSASYTSQEASGQSSKLRGAAASSRAASSEELFQNVRTAVIDRLGDTVDPRLLETIIRRVLKNVGAD